MRKTILQELFFDITPHLMANYTKDVPKTFLPDSFKYELSKPVLPKFYKLL